jgi:hypothetical protein
MSNGENVTLYNPTEPVVVEKSFVQPTLSANGTMGGDSFACSYSGSVASGQPYYAFDGNNSTGCYFTTSRTSYLKFYHPTGLKISKVQFYCQELASYFTNVKLYASNTDSNYTEIATFSRTNNDWIATSSNQTFYKYWEISVFVNTQSSSVPISEVAITGTHMVTVSGGTDLSSSPCTITTCDGRTKSFDVSSVIDCSSQADGTYNVLKDYSTGELSLISNLAISKTEPDTPSSGDCWVDSSVIPASFKAYNGSVWNTDNNKVYIGDVTVESNVITAVSNRQFNDSGYLVNKNYHSTFNSCAPDWSAGISKSSSGFTADEDGWLYVCGVAGGGTSSSIRNFSIAINGVVMQIAGISGSTSILNIACAFIPINNGDVITIASSGGGGSTLTFYPMKGDN